MSTPDNVTAHLSRIPADRGPTLPAQNLERFNTAPAPEAHHILLTCLHSPRWAHRLTTHRPYPDLPSLLAAADEATYDLSPSDLTEALAAESLALLPDNGYSAARTALDAAQAAYESRFGHTFVICLDDVPPDEAPAQVLAAIRSRLTNDPEEERIVAAEELRRLARERLRNLLKGRGTASIGGSAAGRDQPQPTRTRRTARTPSPVAAPSHPSVHF